MEKVLLKIIALSYSQSQSGAYALILGEDKGMRRLPIIIGAFEAQSIVLEIEKIKLERPITHDLFKSFADIFNVSMKHVIINRFSEGVFYAALICEFNGKTYEIDSRTSDAVALALRFGCPIYTYEKILKDAGVIIDINQKYVTEPTDIESSRHDNLKNELKHYTDKELKTLLEKAVTNEEFEKASVIRDEIEKREK